MAVFYQIPVTMRKGEDYTGGLENGAGHDYNVGLRMETCRDETKNKDQGEENENHKHCRQPEGKRRKHGRTTQNRA
jgi:hypothetical protein